MLSLRIPDTIKLLNKNLVLKMPPQEREKYYEKVIFDILMANKEGATVSEIARSTAFSSRAIRNHLDKMIARGEIYSVFRGGVGFYFAYGVMQEKALIIKSKSREGSCYVITSLENADGNFYYIQQKELDDYRALRVKGAIMVSKDDGEEFIKQFHTQMIKEVG